MPKTSADILVTSTALSCRCHRFAKSVPNHLHRAVSIARCRWNVCFPAVTVTSLESLSHARAGRMPYAKSFSSVSAGCVAFLMASELSITGGSASPGNALRTAESSASLPKRLASAKSYVWVSAQTTTRLPLNICAHMHVHTLMECWRTLSSTSALSPGLTSFV